MFERLGGTGKWESGWEVCQADMKSSDQLEETVVAVWRGNQPGSADPWGVRWRQAASSIVQATPLAYLFSAWGYFSLCDTSVIHSGRVAHNCYRGD